MDLYRSTARMQLRLLGYNDCAAVLPDNHVTQLQIFVLACARYHVGPQELTTGLILR